MWNDYAPGWERWDEFITASYRTMTDVMIDALPAASALARILDFATGTGEPGITLARALPNAHVLGVDVSSGMLATAERKARAAGVANFSVQQVGDVPLALSSQSFDA